MCVTAPPRIDPMTPSTIVEKIVICTCITDFAITPEMSPMRTYQIKCNMLFPPASGYDASDLPAALLLHMFGFKDTFQQGLNVIGRQSVQLSQQSFRGRPPRPPRPRPPFQYRRLSLHPHRP